MNNYTLLTQNLFRKVLIAVLLLSAVASLQAQVHTEQNGIKTSVIANLSANATQARRFEVATVGYNSFHWQQGGIIIAELFSYSYATGYEKYSIEIGYNQGAQGVPVVKLLDSQGLIHFAKITLGNYTDLTTLHGDKVNRVVPIYVDVKDYANYKVRLTYMQTRVSEINGMNQIKINETPTPVNIPGFAVPTIDKGKIYTSEDIVTDKNISIENNSMIGRALSDTFTYDNKPMGHYALRWGNDSQSTGFGPALWQSAYGGMKFFTQGLPRMFIHFDGKVGIGTVKPTEMLEVAGTIRAREVKVEVNAGADYVFDKDYNLPSLDQVEAHIREHKHLPEIPSEKQMQEEGLSVNEFQIKLLQKIEELTLYMIKQDKLNKEQAKQIQSQSKEIEELKRQINNN